MDLFLVARDSDRRTDMLTPSQVVALLGVGVQNPQDVRFVSPSFDGTAPFYSTIASALAGAPTVCTIVIYEGTYAERISLTGQKHLVAIGHVTLAPADSSTGAVVNLTNGSLMLGDWTFDMTGVSNADYALQVNVTNASASVQTMRTTGGTNGHVICNGTGSTLTIGFCENADSLRVNGDGATLRATAHVVGYLINNNGSLDIDVDTVRFGLTLDGDDTNVRAQFIGGGVGASNVLLAGTTMVKATRVTAPTTMSGGTVTMEIGDLSGDMTVNAGSLTLNHAVRSGGTVLITNAAGTPYVRITGRVAADVQTSVTGGRLVMNNVAYSGAFVGPLINLTGGTTELEDCRIVNTSNNAAARALTANGANVKCSVQGGRLEAQGDRTVDVDDVLGVLFRSVSIVNSAATGGRDGVFLTANYLDGTVATQAVAVYIATVGAANGFDTNVVGRNPSVINYGGTAVSDANAATITVTGVAMQTINILDL